MDSFEINKIIAAILLTALIVIGLGKVVDILFYVEKPKMSAYKVEGIEQGSSDQKVSAKTETRTGGFCILQRGAYRREGCGSRRA